MDSAMDTAEATAAAAADAKLADLRTQRAHAVSVLPAVANLPEVHLALEARITALDAELSVLLVQRQQALDPHQLCQLLSQRQAQSTAAAKELADNTATAASALEASDKEAAATEAKGKAQIAQLLAWMDTLVATAAATRKALVDAQTARQAHLERTSTEADAALASAQAAYSGSRVKFCHAAQSLRSRDVERPPQAPCTAAGAA